MMVRSAVKLVSNTLSKPARRRAVFISKVTPWPGSRPKHSPMAERGAGAVWMTTCLVGSSMAAQTASVSSLAYSAPVGQRLMHWPQLMQTTSPSGLFVEGLDVDLVAAVDGFEDADLLQVDAGAHAAAAADALVHVAHDRVARVVDDGYRLVGMAEAELGDAVLLGQGLQFAVAVALAGVALAVVLGEQQLEHVPACETHAAAVGVDGHLVGHREGAGGLQGALAFDFDHADAADTGHVEVGMVAESGDVDPDGLGGLQDGRAEGDLGFDAVDAHRDGGADGVGTGRCDHAPRLLRERGAVEAGRCCVGHAHSLATRAADG